MFDSIISRLKNAECIGIFAHENPDGDAMGSAYSLKLTLIGMGKRAEVFLCPDPDSSAYELVIQGNKTDVRIEECDLLAAVDCAERRRLGCYEEVFMNHPNTVAVDHHITHIPFAKEMAVKDISSCCELMTQLYENMGIEISKDIANNLYLGMVTDTGNFKYSSVTSDTFRYAAKLIDCGAEFSKIAKCVFDTKTMEYYSLMRVALERLKVYENGRIGVLYLSAQDFEKAGLKESEASSIVTLVRTVKGVEAGVYIRQREEGSYKVSLRSSDNIDVSKTAAAFGGGGHVRASGYTVAGSTVDRIVEDVIAELKKQLKEEC